MSQLEKMQIKMCNANDQAYQQIAITGFKTGSAEQRIHAVKAFIVAECRAELQCTVTNEEKGPRNKRELTETTLITFVDTSSLDKALKVIETNTQRVQIRILVRRSRSWAHYFLQYEHAQQSKRSEIWLSGKLMNLCKFEWLPRFLGHLSKSIGQCQCGKFW